MVRGGLDFKVDFKVKIKGEHSGNTKEYFEESFFFAFRGSRQVRWIRMGRYDSSIVFKVDK